jgi:hypothetical protein
MSKEYSIEETTQWVFEYYTGYEKYMRKHHFKLYEMFYMNIHPPQKIGDCVGIMQGKIHTDKDYAEIMKISKEFCEKYENPINFPKDF